MKTLPEKTTMLKYILFLIFFATFAQTVKCQQSNTQNFAHRLLLNTVVDITILHQMGKQDWYGIWRYFVPFKITHRLTSDNMLLGFAAPDLLSVKPFMAGCEVEGNKIKSICMVFLEDASQVRESLVRNLGAPHQKARFSISGDDTIDTGSTFWQMKDFYVIAISTSEEDRLIYRVALFIGQQMAK